MFACGSDLRRELVRQARVVNGIDYLEVSDDQRSLFVHFVLPLPGTGADAVPADPALALAPHHVVINGGVRRRDIQVTGVSAAAEVLTVAVSRDGDFSIYTLELRGTDPDHPADPPPGFDPQLSSVDFSFKAGCDSEFDCPIPIPPGAPPQPPDPDIDYLAKDYASLRRLMLDRLSMTVPGWTERSPADLQVTLVELLAYAADRRSYQQDAAGTEAYLSTARHRVSVRRHARLLDYRMHDGRNARAFVQLTVADDVLLVRGGNDPANATSLAASTRLLAGAPDASLVFLPLHQQQLRTAHNSVDFYAWGDQECVLPIGAIGATVRDDGLDLQAGDLLLLEEIRGVADSDQPADPAARQVVRMTSVRAQHDPVTATDVLTVGWDPADALTVPIHVSARIPAETGPLVQIAVARGNVVVCDHGDPVLGEPLVPAQLPASGRYRPQLRRSPLTFATPYDPTQPAAFTCAGDPRQALPEAMLNSSGLTWSPRPDLLASDSQDPGFVAEVEADGTTTLRFGDGVHGRPADPGDTFTADYRVGNGAAGNLPAGAITGIAPADERVIGVRQPLPATGGVDPEPAQLVKRLAPDAYRSQERAITEADYAELAKRFPGVQKATAELRWTGSWHTVFITVDRVGGAEVTPQFEADLRAFLERYRRAGHDLEISGPVLVPLHLALSACARPEFLAEDVKLALLDALAAIFAPDNLTFGQPVYLSQVYRTALAVPGVASAQATAFERYGRPAPADVPTVITPGSLEILQLANDPNFPEHGKLDVTVAGGR